MTRRRRGYLTVDVDLSKAVDEMTDEMLIEELTLRKLPLGRNHFDPMDDLRDMREELLRGRSAHALAILERLIYPKWPNVQACETDFNKSRR